MRRRSREASPRRILVITPSAAPVLGGIETVLETLETAWRQNGHHCDVLVTSGHAREMQPAERKYNLRNALRLAKRADLVLVANSSFRGFPLWLRHPRKTYLQHHSDYSHGREMGRRATILWRARRYWIALAKNVCVSPWLYNRLPGRSTVILNPLPQALQPALSTARQHVFVFAGRMVAEKGLDTLLVATSLSARPDIRVVVAGDGPLMEDMRLLAERLGLSHRVEWLGRLSQEQTLNLFQTARWVVVPSRYEPFGMVAFEALARGAMVITSDADNLGEMLPGYAYIFPAGQAEQLAQIMDGCLAGEMEQLQFPDELLATCDAQSVAAKYLNLPTG